MSNEGELIATRTEIVMLGTFDPNDALPEKLAAARTLTPEEASSAKLKSLMVAQIVEYELEWGSVQSIPQRLIVKTTQAPFVRAADLALKLARESPKTVVTMFGINREYDYRFSSMAARDTLGIRLSPPGSWGAWGIEVEKEMRETAGDKHPGLLAATMRRVMPADREAGWVDATVMAAGSATDVKVTVRINDHYAYSPEKDPENLSADSHASSRTTRLLDTLFNNFDESVKRSDVIANGIIHT